MLTPSISHRAKDTATVALAKAQTLSPEYGSSDTFQNELEWICQEERVKLPKSMCAKVVETYPKTPAVVISAKTVLSLKLNTSLKKDLSWVTEWRLIGQMPVLPKLKLNVHKVCQK